MRDNNSNKKSKMNEKHYSLEHVIHPWNPIFNENSKILILGSFPSPKSRLNGFYYGHPQNIFWDTIAKILNVPAPAPACA